MRHLDGLWHNLTEWRHREPATAPSSARGGSSSSFDASLSVSPRTDLSADTARTFLDDGRTDPGLVIISDDSDDAAAASSQAYPRMSEHDKRKRFWRQNRQVSKSLTWGLTLSTPSASSKPDQPSLQNPNAAAKAPSTAVSSDVIPLLTIHGPSTDNDGPDGDQSPASPDHPDAAAASSSAAAPVRAGCEHRFRQLHSEQPCTCAACKKDIAATGNSEDPTLQCTGWPVTGGVAWCTRNAAVDAHRQPARQNVVSASIRAALTA